MPRFFALTLAFLTALNLPTSAIANTSPCAIVSQLSFAAAAQEQENKVLQLIDTSTARLFKRQRTAAQFFDYVVVVEANPQWHAYYQKISAAGAHASLPPRPEGQAFQQLRETIEDELSVTEMRGQTGLSKNWTCMAKVCSMIAFSVGTSFLSSNSRGIEQILWGMAAGVTAVLASQPGKIDWKGLSFGRSKPVDPGTNPNQKDNAKALLDGIDALLGQDKKKPVKKDSFYLMVTDGALSPALTQKLSQEIGLQEIQSNAIPQVIDRLKYPLPSFKLTLDRSGLQPARNIIEEQKLIIQKADAQNDIHVSILQDLLKNGELTTVSELVRMIQEDRILLILGKDALDNIDVPLAYAYPTAGGLVVHARQSLSEAKIAELQQRLNAAFKTTQFKTTQRAVNNIDDSEVAMEWLLSLDLDQDTMEQLRRSIKPVLDQG